MKLTIAALILTATTASADGWDISTGLTATADLATAQASIGYDLGDWTPYGIIGIATDRSGFEDISDALTTGDGIGEVYGAGVRYEFNGPRDARLNVDVSYKEAPAFDAYEFNLSLGMRF